MFVTDVTAMEGLFRATTVINIERFCEWQYTFIIQLIEHSAGFPVAVFIKTFKIKV